MGCFCNQILSFNVSCVIIFFRSVARPFYFCVMIKHWDFISVLVVGMFQFLASTYWSQSDISAFAGNDYMNSFNSSESTDESEKQSFSFSSIYKDLNKTDNTKYRAGNVPSLDLGGDFGILDGPDEVSDTLSDGMELKLKKTATYFEFDHHEVSRDNYSFRPDYNFQSGMTYDTKVYPVIELLFCRLLN